MTQQNFLNLGCGRVILPAPAPAHYSLLPPGLTDYALWHNVDRNLQPGVDQAVDLFRYPWPFADNSYDGALCAHLCEHIPHSIDTGVAQPGSVLYDRYHVLQDGWFAFFSELYRVLTPGALIHVISPYAWSQGGVTDPTHQRLLTPDSFTHSMQPNPDAPFAYATGGLNLAFEEARFNITPDFAHLTGQPGALERAINTQINVAYEFYVRLKVVK